MKPNKASGLVAAVLAVPLAITHAKANLNPDPSLSSGLGVIGAGLSPKCYNENTGEFTERYYPIEKDGFIYIMDLCPPGEKEESESDFIEEIRKFKYDILPPHKDGIDQ